MYELYDELEAIQKLVWRNDDRMDQETLFELQDRLAEVVLHAAQNEYKVDRLLKAFPFLYQADEE